MNDSKENSQNRKHKFLISPRSCSALIALFLISCCCITTVLLIFKPEAFWSKFSNYLNENNNYAYEYSNLTEQDVQASIRSQIESIGENNVYISEDELNILLKNRFIGFKNIHAEIEEDLVYIYWQLDNTTNPVFARLEIEFNNKKLEVRKFGTIRYYLPDITYPLLNKFTEKAINQDIISSQINLIKLDKNINIQDIKFLKDKVYLKLFVNVKLFQDD